MRLTVISSTSPFKRLAIAGLLGPRAPYNSCMCRGILALGVALALTFGAWPAWAGRPVEVYEVTVRGADAGAAAQEAMRLALVRATGRQDAATDPAFSQLIAHADQYVRSTRPAGEGATQVLLDGPAIERQITAAGRSVWDATRPFTIVVLSPAPTGAQDDETRRAVELIAEGRGLPVSLVPMAVTDASGNPLGADVLLTSAQRLGGDAVLVGRSEPSAAGAPPGAAGGSPPSAPGAAGAQAGVPSGPADVSSASWQWTLITGLASRSWNGSLDAGINGAADALARVAGSALPLTEEAAVVKVNGIGTLADYATVERTLEELPGVRVSGLEETDGASATFRVVIRGGAEAIERALEGSDHLMRLAGDPSLAYQYHP